MATQPVSNILIREFDDPQVVKRLGQFSDSIEEAVSFGTHIIKWCLEDIPESKRDDAHLVPILLFRHALELLDSISILVRPGSIDPSKIILRGLLETVMSIEWILQADTNRRAMAFWVWHAHHNLRIYEKLDPASNSGKQFRSKLKKDRYGKNLSIPQIPDLQQMTKNLNNLLTKPAYAQAELEYQRLSQGRRKNPDWYSFFGGPPNREQLADKIGLSGIYEVLYRNWSDVTHGTDVIKGKLSSPGKGQIEIVQIRFVKDVQTVTQNSLSLALQLFVSMIKYFAPNREKDFENWYASEIRDSYNALSGPQIITVE